MGNNDYPRESDFLSDDQIQRLAEEILGQEAIKVDRRSWATFWCPFHPDRASEGRGGRPNFGVNLSVGNWNCFRCNASGPSLWKLADELNQNPPNEYFEERDRYLEHLGRTPFGASYQTAQMHDAPPDTYFQARDDHELRDEAPSPRVVAEDIPVRKLDEAVSWARWALWSCGEADDARHYILNRGVSQVRALQYGLGYGLGTPDVEPETLVAAQDALLAKESKYDVEYWWQWDGSIVYADPPVNPRVIQVRHLAGWRATELKYQSWGRFLEPLGTWRAKMSTEIIIAVEGLFDMLVFAEELTRRHISKVIPVSLGGASPSYESLEWLVRHPAAKMLVPDPDDAGEELVERYLRIAENLGETDPYIVVPPNGLDPDEAILDGWFPI